jgi:chemotaxis response regulator CheB
VTLVVLLTPADLGRARTLPSPRRLCTSVGAALTELRRAPPAATLLLVDPAPDLDWADLREQLRPLRTRLIVAGGRVPPGVRQVPTLEAALPLLGRPAAPNGGAGTGMGTDRHGAAADPAPAVMPLTLIGASTGGPRALQDLLTGLRPRGAVVIAQHLSEGFSDNLTQWLGTLTSAPVLNPAPGEPLRPGTITVVSGTHVTLSGDTLRVHPGQPGREYLPSIDRLFQSGLTWRGPLNAVLLSGMGDDGAAGLAALHAAAARTAVQDPDSATVPSMPAQALARVRPSVQADPHGLRVFLERHA